MAHLNRRRVLKLLILQRRLQRQRRYLKHKKKFWVRPLFQERKLKGEFYCLVKDMKLFDHEFFFKQFRMLPHKFEELLGSIVPEMVKSSLKTRIYFT